MPNGYRFPYRIEAGYSPSMEHTSDSEDTYVNKLCKCWRIGCTGGGIVLVHLSYDIVFPVVMLNKIVL